MNIVFAFISHIALSPVVISTAVVAAIDAVYGISIYAVE